MANNKPAAAPTDTAAIVPVVPTEIMQALSAMARYGMEQTELEDNFCRAIGVATAVARLRELLSPQVMAPIMQLQGSAIGFLSDREYDVDTVRTVLIQAAIEGLSIYGNQFNILGGRMYVTKGGMAAKLRRLAERRGLRHTIVIDPPRMAQGDRGAICAAHLTWQLRGEEPRTQDLNIPVRVNSGMGADAILGKATRKARAWLYEEITGNEVPEGEVGESAPIDITPRQAATATATARTASPLPQLQAM